MVVEWDFTCAENAKVRLSAGAEFIVLICGDVMAAPERPKVPSANAIGVNDEGKIVGLF